MIFLVLEDNVEIAEDIVKTINSIETDSKVLVAPTIREGFELAKRNEIDVFLIDIHLPDGNGIDFSRKIREDYEQHPIITISDNYSDEAQLRMFREVKGLAYLPKPFRREELIEEISNAIKLATLIDDKTLTIKMKKTVYVFKVSEIVYIERTDSKELFNGKIRAWNARSFHVSEDCTVYTDFESASGNKSNPSGSVSGSRTLILDL